MKRFRSNLYTVQKIVCADRQHVYVENEDGYSAAVSSVQFCWLAYSAMTSFALLPELL